MFSIFQSKSKQRIGFEDIKIIINNSSKYILINTLNVGEQDILIKNTIYYNEEENIINTIAQKISNEISKSVVHKIK